MTSVTPIHVHFPGQQQASQTLCLRQRGFKGMPVIGIAGESLHANNETLPAGAHHAYLDTKLVGFMRFTLGNTFDFRSMNTVDLAFVVTLL